MFPSRAVADWACDLSRIEAEAVCIPSCFAIAVSFFLRTSPDLPHHLCYTANGLSQRLTYLLDDFSGPCRAVNASSALRWDAPSALHLLRFLALLSLALDLLLVPQTL